MTVSPPHDTTIVPTLINTTYHDSDWEEDQSFLSIGDDKTSSTCTSKSSCGPLHEKRISFNSCVDFVEVPHLNEFSPEDIDAIWISQKEYTNIKMAVKQSVIFKVKYGIIDDDLEFCARGLETKDDTVQRRLNQKEAVASVLNEQYLQRMETSVSDMPELIAMLYSVFSYPCQQRAHTLALRDAVDVDETHYGGHCEVPFESEMPYPGDSVLQRIAEEEQISLEETFSSIEQWLVERFEKGERFAEVSRVRQYTMANMDVE